MWGFAGAPASTPSKSSGNLVTSTRAWRPPVEQPFQYEYFESCAVVGLDESFGLDDGFVHRAPAEIDDFFRMAEREHAVAALMTGVGGSGGVSIAQRGAPFAGS